MDSYKIALEMALGFRYQEARKKLLELLLNEPDNIEALILLGKVEYYLKLYTSSRQRFESALLYEPDNFQAYLGLQYYKERRKKSVILITSFISFLFFVSLFSYFFISLSNHLNMQTIILNNQINLLKEEINITVENIINKVDDLEEKTVIYSTSVNLNNETINKSLDDMKNDIISLCKTQETLLEKYETLSKWIIQNTQKNND